MHGLRFGRSYGKSETHPGMLRRQPYIDKTDRDNHRRVHPIDGRQLCLERNGTRVRRNNRKRDLESAGIEDSGRYQHPDGLQGFVRFAGYPVFDFASVRARAVNARYRSHQSADIADIVVERLIGRRIV